MAWKEKKKQYLAMRNDPKCRLTKKEMAQELGVCTATLRNWEREEESCKEPMGKKKTTQPQSEWAILKSVLFQKALEGDVAAARLLLQTRDMNLDSNPEKGLTLEEALALIADYLKFTPIPSMKTDSEN